ncbi:hypothetical protein QL285_068956 [Trifolium repens]|nr:hypothetical protein QL285_068956 [Trifolium repens]
MQPSFNSHMMPSLLLYHDYPYYIPIMITPINFYHDYLYSSLFICKVRHMHWPNFSTSLSTILYKPSPPHQHFSSHPSSPHSRF